MTSRCHSAPQITVISLELWRFILLTYTYKCPCHDAVLKLFCRYENHYYKIDVFCAVAVAKDWNLFHQLILLHRHQRYSLQLINLISVLCCYWITNHFHATATGWKVKALYSSSWKSISELWGVTCHMRSHSVTCHPTKVNVTRLNPSQTGRYSI